jgi:hypothetical protein
MNFRRRRAADVAGQVGVRGHGLNHLMQAERVLHSHTIEAFVDGTISEPALDP